MNIKNDKRKFLVMIYDRYERYLLGGVTENSFIIGIDFEGINIDIKYNKGVKDTIIEIRYFDPEQDFKSSSHKFIYPNNYEMKDEDYIKVFNRYINAVSDLVAIWNIDKLKGDNWGDSFDLSDYSDEDYNF